MVGSIGRTATARGSATGVLGDMFEKYKRFEEVGDI